ncbi:YkgJ family cysteine cluster protein [Desulfolutivibrio sulfoxidireducens]|uniref:YkgJ family cysteine cluster protein n=1 Tax=Desulfolutivibrio sulfoxidireducens TaxID=2773299 RepID=UPI00159DAF4F|nr:hypothetical protein [Desulfolutivibrio sulfoxidireducens]QLA17463.1 hypothetical protein GD605_15925 [Desulfolutivibrio sulfoxidireducens]QLA21050.1 hypothetical protein GD604_15630 [Desulfolutivibrio sulfoxidireducens]
MTGPRRNALLARLSALYRRMDAAYDAVSGPLGFSCDGCATNCCTSYFQHHTYVEWLYLFQGLSALPDERRELYLERAARAVAATREALARGERPRVMCPVNDDGLCGLYAHRLMICRLHGVAHVLIGRAGVREFPGCPRCETLRAAHPGAGIMDRTVLYRELAAIEMELVGKKAARPPKVDATLAEMLVAGPPRV